MKIPVRVTAPRFELKSQRQKVSRLPTEPPGRPEYNSSTHGRKYIEVMSYHVLKIMYCLVRFSNVLLEVRDVTETSNLSSLLCGRAGSGVRVDGLRRQQSVCLC